MKINGAYLSDDFSRRFVDVVSICFVCHVEFQDVDADAQ